MRMGREALGDDEIDASFGVRKYYPLVMTNSLLLKMVIYSEFYHFTH